jgi:hypothetical protein
MKKFKPFFDFKTNLQLGGGLSTIFNKKPPASQLDSKGCFIVHDIMEDELLVELFQKV